MILHKPSTGRQEGVSTPELVSGVFPLSFAQESLWLEEQISVTSAYNMPEAWRLRGRLNVPALRRALDAMVARHETLRTVFRREKGMPVQEIRRAGTFPLRQEFIGSRGAGELETAIRRECRTRFDLENGPMLRGVLYRISEEDHILLVIIHHIVCDAWSQTVFIRELADVYSAFVAGRPESLPELPIQFADFAVWQRETFSGEPLTECLGYWAQRLAGSPAPATLLPDFPRPEGARFHEGCTQFHALEPKLFSALMDFSRARHVTLFATLLAAFKVLLQRHTRENDITVGCPIAGRERVETERLIGLFVNTHAIRTDLSGDPAFSRVLEGVRDASLEALANQHVPLNRIVDEVKSGRTDGRNPLFQIVFGLQTEPADDIMLPHLRVQRMELDNGAAKFDWTLLLSRTAHGISIRSEHRSSLYRAETINRLIGQYERLLRGILAEPDKRISEYDLVSPEERRLILGRWNQTESRYDRDSTVHECFSAKAKWNPDRVALVYEGRRITYGEMDERSTSIASVLQEAGLMRGDKVVLNIDRSPELIFAMLGVLKTGGAYVPLDRLYPPERQALICRESGAKLILSDREVAIADSGLPVIRLATAYSLSAPGFHHVVVAAEDAAYVMFTSGSTGTPKGVTVPHRAILRLVQNPNYVQIRSEDTFLQFAPAAFDASTFEIWGALLNGARLVIAPPHLPSLSELGRTIRQENVTILWLTAGLFNQMVDNEFENLRGVRQLLAGGESLSAPHVTRALGALPSTTIINGYGPTENTTFSCCYRIPRDWKEQASVPIGVPISNSHACVLDEHFRLCPVGMPGELYVWGDGLATEYDGRPDLTSGSFFHIALEPNKKPERMYRTGDLARWLQDGAIEFLGRIDLQMKIRGFRIEPGEIEAVLASHPAVDSAVVIAVDRPCGKQLVAYVAKSQKKTVSPSDLATHTSARLPSYMVPAAFVFLDRLPLNANGKVDRRALPMPSFETELEGDRILPRSDAEQRVARVWEDVLGRNGFDVRQDFFELGGHSLLATQAASRLSEVFGIEVPVIALFEHRTIEALARALPGNGAVRHEPGRKINRHLAPGRARELLSHLNDLPDEEIQKLLEEFGELK